MMRATDSCDMWGWSYEWSPNSTKGSAASSAISSGWASTQSPDTKIVVGMRSRLSTSNTCRSKPAWWLRVAQASKVMATVGCCVGTYRSGRRFRIPAPVGGGGDGAAAAAGAGEAPTAGAGGGGTGGMDGATTPNPANAAMARN